MGRPFRPSAGCGLGGMLVPAGCRRAVQRCRSRMSGVAGARCASGRPRPARVDRVHRGASRAGGGRGRNDLLGFMVIRDFPQSVSVASRIAVARRGRPTPDWHPRVREEDGSVRATSAGRGQDAARTRDVSQLRIGKDSAGESSAQVRAGFSEERLLVESAARVLPLLRHLGRSGPLTCGNVDQRTAW
jgi:hypothetical protein